MKIKIHHQLNDKHLTQDRVHLGTGGAAIKILDPDTGRIRSTTLDDLYKVSRLVDQLSNIHSVGPGGDFMTSPHTMSHLRKEHYTGNGVTDRKARGKWESAGSQDARQRALVISKKLLANEKSYIPDDIDAAIREKFNILLPNN